MPLRHYQSARYRENLGSWRAHLTDVSLRPTSELLPLDLELGTLNELNERTISARNSVDDGWYLM